MICVFLTELGYASHDNYRTEHGRKELLYQTSVQLLDTATLCGLSKLSVGCLDLYHGSDWLLCACKVGHSWHAGCCVHTVPNESQRAQCVHLFYLESIVYLEWGPATGCLQERAHSWLN